MALRESKVRDMALEKLKNILWFRSRKECLKRQLEDLERTIQVIKKKPKNFKVSSQRTSLRSSFLIFSSYFGTS